MSGDLQEARQNLPITTDQSTSLATLLIHVCLFDLTPPAIQCFNTGYDVKPVSCSDATAGACPHHFDQGAPGEGLTSGHFSSLIQLPI